MRTAISLTAACAGAVLAFGALQAQPPRPRIQRAEVAIAIDGARAHVQERFEFASNPGALSFELLGQRCATVRGIRVQSNGADVPVASEDNPPWLRLHDTSAVDPSRGSLGYTLTYVVELRDRTASIPILLPMAVLIGSRRGDPIAQVSVAAPTGVRVVVPRLARASEGGWSARMAALPAAVRVSGVSPNAECSDIAEGESGRFTLIFWLLVATLVIWVPTYLTWANRQRQTA